MRRLGSNVYKIAKYIITPLYLLGKDLIVILTPREIYIINNLKANILISIDIIVPEKIDIIAS